MKDLRIKPINKYKLITLFKKGLTLREMALFLNVSPGTIRDRLFKFGVLLTPDESLKSAHKRFGISFPSEIKKIEIDKKILNCFRVIYLSGGKKSSEKELQSKMDEELKRIGLRYKTPILPWQIRELKNKINKIPVKKKEPKVLKEPRNPGGAVGFERTEVLKEPRVKRVIKKRVTSGPKLWTIINGIKKQKPDMFSTAGSERTEGVVGGAEGTPKVLKEPRNPEGVHINFNQLARYLKSTPYKIRKSLRFHKELFQPEINNDISWLIEYRNYIIQLISYQENPADSLNYKESDFVKLCEALEITL